MEILAPGSTGAMGIVISLVLIAFGAILAWAVNTNGGSVDPQVVGVILIVVGIIVFLISLVLWRTWWGAGFWSGGYGDPAAPGGVVRRRVYRPAVRRTTYVEEEPPPPPGLPLRRRQRATKGVLMADKLQGKRVAFLATDMVEQVELTEPWKAVERGRRHARADLARGGRDPGLQPLRQGRHVQGRQDRRGGERRRLRRARAPGRRRQSGHAADGRERGRARARSSSSRASRSA